MKDSINIRQFEHSWRMPSLIVRLKAVNPSDEVVVIGAHLDSINRQNWRINVWTGRAPGANDDATGVAILMEMFRVFVQHKVRPISRSLEIHIYSGEEEGLYGSRDISAEYFRNHVKVASMLQLDQCGWLRNSSDEKIAIYTDHTDPKLTSLLKDLTLEYVSNASIIIDNENNRADSDFHSWHINGYRAAYVSEGPIDDIVYGNSKHTSYDFDKTVSMDHVMKFASIAVAYSLELTKTA
jgi:leucyl aminopeptidase